MTLTAHLETSFTFVTPNVLKKLEKAQVNEQTFQSQDEHFVLGNDALGEIINRFALQELPLVKIPVGSPDHAEIVEFYALDAKKNKKESDALKKLLSKHWIDLLWSFEGARQDNLGDVTTLNINAEASALEGFLLLRRFLVTGLDPEFISKKKRSILLFHHTAGNAPTN